MHPHIDLFNDIKKFNNTKFCVRYVLTNVFKYTILCLNYLTLNKHKGTGAAKPERTKEMQTCNNK